METIDMTKQVEATEVQVTVEETNKGEIKMRNRAMFNKVECAEIESASEQLSAIVMNKMGINSPLSSVFLGKDIDQLVVNGAHEQFEATKDGQVLEVPFHTLHGKQLISLLMFQIPSQYEAFKQTKQFAVLQSMDLQSRLTAKAKVHGRKTRDSVLMGAINTADVYIVKGTEVLFKYDDMDEMDASTHVIRQVGRRNKVVVNEDIRFVVAKDMRPEYLHSTNTLFQKMTLSLAVHRFATILNKRMVEVRVKKEAAIDGMTFSINEPQRMILLEEMCIIDSGGAGQATPYDNEINEALFAKIEVVQSTTGELELGSTLATDEAVKSYGSYFKSMSQARTGGAMAVDSLENAVKYLEATGHDHNAHSADHFTVDAEGNKMYTGFKSVNMTKAYKRLVVTGSNGTTPTKGFLASFQDPKSVIKTTEELNGLQYDKIVVTNKADKTYTIVVLEDFYSYIDKSQPFLYNKVGQDGLVGIVEFTEWDNPQAIEKLLRHLASDGSGYVDAKTTHHLRQESLISQNDAFQIRMSHSIKGAVIQFDLICELFGANMVLTEGMVKASQIEYDLKKRGMQIFVVGQRKDGPDGIWLSSQATQQMHLTLEELQQAVNNSVDFVSNAINQKMPDDLLAMIDASDDETDTEYAVTDYIRLAKEVDAVLDEQYIIDQEVQLAIRKLNKLLDAKVFIENARTRYMFTDPFAIYNAAKAGRYQILPEDAVLKANEIVTPSKKDEGFYQQTGEVVSCRFPLSAVHEIPVLDAVVASEYETIVESGLWQGCTFFDAFSWAVETQAGADFDGDGSAVIFDSLFVEAVKRAQSGMFGGHKVLPLIDGYGEYVDGEAVNFDKGCPTYVPKSSEDEEGTQDVESGPQTINGFEVEDRSVVYDPVELVTEQDKFKLLSAMAEVSKDITVTTLDESLIGQIANRVMVATDLLSRSVLNKKERTEIEKDLMLLAVAGRWEIDRPKHGGAYLEMPVIAKLFRIFNALKLDETQLDFSTAKKEEILKSMKKQYSHIFAPMINKINEKAVVIGFSVKKPQWLASQKDEYGIKNDDSLYENIFGSQVNDTATISYSEMKIIELCEQFAGSSDKANNIRGLISNNMEMGLLNSTNAKRVVQAIYEAYKVKEDARRLEQGQFILEAEKELEDSKEFQRKNKLSMTSAKKNAVIRKHYRDEMTTFKVARELLQAEFRKEMYLTAMELRLDVRSLVGALYLVIQGATGQGTSSYSKDGSEFRFRTVNGFIALPFELFEEEMNSLISGKISETYFMPQDTTFTMLQTRLMNQPVASAGLFASEANQDNSLKVRVVNPKPQQEGKTYELNKSCRVAIKPIMHNGQARMAMHFLNGVCELEEAMDVTREDSAYIAFAPEQFQMSGIYEMPLVSITFSKGAESAVIRFDESVQL